MNKTIAKILTVSIPLLFVIGFTGATYGAEKLGTDPSIWQTILYYIRKVIAYGIPVMFVLGFIEAHFQITKGMLGYTPDQVAEKLPIHPSAWRMIGYVDGLQAVNWTIILVGVYLGNENLVRYITIFTFGMYVVDLSVTVPMWKTFPWPGFSKTALITILIQLAYLLSIGWLMAAR
jgi:hypothetical protein